MELSAWSDLPIELWKVVAEKLPLEDYNRFAGVCTTWRSLIQEIRPYKFPWLVLSDLDSNRPEPNTHPFFNLLETKVCGLRVPQLRGKRCCGSSHGWLITASQHSNSFHLLNPFSGVEISLPPPSAFPHPQYPRYPHFPRDYYFIRKAVLSSDPATSSQYTVMAIYSDPSWLAFFKSGSDKWIHINTPKLGFRDLMYSNGRFYAHTLQGRVVVCNLEDDDHPRITEITPPLRVYPTPPMWTLKGDDNRPYLAESSTGELLQVWRMLIYHGEICQHKNFPPRSTVSVKVFKIDEKVQGGGRVEVRSLGSDTILFIGTSNSISVSVKHFPNLKGNRIFFEDDHYGPLKEEEHDFVVYDLDDGSIKPFLRADLTHSYFSLPIWILPNQASVLSPSSFY